MIFNLGRASTFLLLTIIAVIKFLSRYSRCAFQIWNFFIAQNMKLSVKDFFSKCYQIFRKLRIWWHLLKKSLMKNFSFCAVFSLNTLEAYSEPCQTSKCFAKLVNDCKLYLRCLTRFRIRLCTPRIAASMVRVARTE